MIGVGAVITERPVIGPVNYNPDTPTNRNCSLRKVLMIVVLSPAKTLDFVSLPTLPDTTQPAFLDQSQMLVNLLRKRSPLEFSQLMGISDQLATLNVQRYADWSRPFTAENAKQAVLAFNGDVYEGLDAASLSPADLLFAQEHLRILSGLYGVLRPLDLMQPYRLEMSVRLPSRRGKDLYAFWGERISKALGEALRETGAPALVNLASDEYFKAVQPKRLVVPVIQPVFEDWSGGKDSGKFKVVSFYAKRARGLMARFALIERLNDPEGLKSFSAEGYAFVATASDETRWVFRRKLQ